MSLPQEVLEFGIAQRRLRTAKLLLKQGHCAGIDCSECLLDFLGFHGKRICEDCFLNSLVSRSSLRVKALAAKHIADYEEELVEE